jgi:HTH-type transcriptional regulator / antitoxin HigA
MMPRPIRTEEDHQRALADIDRLWNALPGSPEYDELDILATLVEAYEREHHAIEPPDPIEAILFRMEQMGQSRKDLEPILGSRARVSEVLSRKRALTLRMIRKLHRELHIPAEVLIADAVRPPRARRSRAASGTGRTAQTAGTGLATTARGGSRKGGRPVRRARG